MRGEGGGGNRGVPGKNPRRQDLRTGVTYSVPIGDLNPKPLIAVVTSERFNPYTTGSLPTILFVYISVIAEFSHGLQVSGAV